MARAITLTTFAAPQKRTVNELKLMPRRMCDHFGYHSQQRDALDEDIVAGVHAHQVWAEADAPRLVPRPPLPSLAVYGARALQPEAVNLLHEEDVLGGGGVGRGRGVRTDRTVDLRGSKVRRGDEET